MIQLFTGNSRKGTSGFLNVTTGNTVSERSGGMFFKVGQSKEKSGGNIAFTAGDSFGDRTDGGHITFVGGAAPSSTSGSIKFFSNNGVESGEISFLTGKSLQGGSGSVSLITGSTEGSMYTRSRAGSITLSVGSGDGGNGGDIALNAGDTSATHASGGKVTLVAGDGHSTDSFNGGVGGDIQLTAGKSFGRSEKNSDGGHVAINGGEAFFGVGGKVSLQSGVGKQTSSGMLELSTADAGYQGETGDALFSTGKAVEGDAGSVEISGGDSLHGSGGHVELLAGEGSAGHGGRLTLHSATSLPSRFSNSKTVTDSGHVSLHAGSSDGDFVDGGSIWIESGSGGRRASGGSIHLKAYVNKDVIGEYRREANQEIALGLDDGSEGNGNTYAFRLKATSSGQTVISSVPVQVTTVQYSSDKRIKKDIRNVDTDDILQRLQRIQFAEYGYSDAWRRVRGIPDHRVRGVIAQQLYEVFPEHTKMFEKYELEDKNFSISDFMQVDKQGLVLDLIGAFQASHRRFNIGASSAISSANISVRSDNAGEYFGAPINSGGSGSIEVTTGTAISSSGDIMILSGKSSAKNSGSIRIETGESPKGRSGDIVLKIQNSTHAGNVAILAGSTAKNGNNGGNVTAEGGSGTIGGSMTLSTGSGIEQSGHMVLSSRNSIGSAGNITASIGLSETGASGSISMSSGSSLASDGGIVGIRAGNSESASGGEILIKSGSGGITGGSLTLLGGDATAHTNTYGVKNNGGDVHIHSGSGSATNSGSIFISSNKVSKDGTSGNMLFGSGNAAEGESGSIILSTGSSYSSKTGSIDISAGSGENVIAGYVSIKAGSSYGNDIKKKGGNLDFYSGDSESNESGEINIITGFSAFEKSGNILVSPGFAYKGGGNAFIYGGNTTTKKGGDTNLSSGYSVYDNSGK